jgi:hypothetical protein
MLTSLSSWDSVCWARSWADILVVYCELIATVQEIEITQKVLYIIVPWSVVLVTMLCRVEGFWRLIVIVGSRKRVG